MNAQLSIVLWPRNLSIYNRTVMRAWRVNLSSGFSTKVIFSPVSVIFLQICFYESLDSLGKKSLHSQTRSFFAFPNSKFCIPYGINFVYPYKSGPFIEANLGNKTLAYMILTYTIIKIKLTLSCKIIKI